MTFSSEDQFLATLMAYREAANQKDAGITAVLCVARNNAAKHGTTIFTEITKPFRYSSINCPINAKTASLGTLQGLLTELSKFPSQANQTDWALWKHIGDIVAGILSGVAEDITTGATLYYAPAGISSTVTFTLPNGTVVPFPAGWDKSKLQFTTQIGTQLFFREL